MGCVLALCLPLLSNKQEWLLHFLKLLWPPEAAEAHQDVSSGVGDVGEGVDEVPGAFPVLQDVRDGHGVVRGTDAVLGRFWR